MMSVPQRLSSAEDYTDLLDSYDTWLFDCDGVLWRGDNLIDGVLDVLELLRSRSTLATLFTIIHHLKASFMQTRVSYS